MNVRSSHGARGAVTVPRLPRLHVVTGKGGTGKTTLATALAVSLADTGHRVLLCEVEGRQGLSRLLGTEPLPYAEVEVAEGSSGGEVLALAVEPRAALLEYLDTFHGAGRGPAVSGLLDRAGAVDVIASVAPGLRDVLLVGKVYEAVRRTATGRGDGGAPVYDAVVLDAPPTGRITRFLGIGDELAGLAGGGPIAARAASVAELLHSDATVVHLVTLPEELPVTETVEAAAELRAAGLRVGAVVANRVLEAPPPLDAASLAASLEGALDDGGLVNALLAQAGRRERRAQEHRRWLKVLAGATDGDPGAPVRVLPDLPGGVDIDGLYALADTLAAEPLTSSSTASASGAAR